MLQTHTWQTSAQWMPPSLVNHRFLLPENLEKAITLYMVPPNTTRTFGIDLLQSVIQGRKVPIAFLAGLSC